MKKLLFLLALMVCSFKAKAQLVAEWHCDNTVAPTFIDRKRPANCTFVACLILLKAPSSGGAALGARWPCDH